MGVSPTRLIGPAVLKGVEQHVAHGADTGFDPGEAVVMGFAILAVLALDAVAFGDEFAVELRQQGLVGEGFP